MTLRFGSNHNLDEWRAVTVFTTYSIRTDDDARDTSYIVCSLRERCILC